jgi:hypothetical protein
MIWNPIASKDLSMAASASSAATAEGGGGGGVFRLEDRAVGVPLVIKTLLEWMRKRNILDSGYSYMRDASSIRDENIQYETVYRMLFKRAVVLDTAVAGSYISQRNK